MELCHFIVLLTDWLLSNNSFSTTFSCELVNLPTNWSPLRGDSCLSSNPVTKTPNGNQLEDSLSTSTLRTRRRTYSKERPAEVTRPKKATKESNKPKGPQIKEESLRGHAQREILNTTENLTMSMSMTTGVLGMLAPGSKKAPVSQMITYLICDWEKKFFKVVQARFR